jgi:hypothetical protein
MHISRYVTVRVGRCLFYQELLNHIYVFMHFLCSQKTNGCYNNRYVQVNVVIYQTAVFLLLIFVYAFIKKFIILSTSSLAAMNINIRVASSVILECCYRKL